MLEHAHAINGRRIWAIQTVLKGVMAAQTEDDYDALFEAATAEAEWSVDIVDTRANTKPEDLRHGPTRSELPESLQNASKEETVCE